MKRGYLHHLAAALLPLPAFFSLVRPGTVPYYCDPVIQSYPYYAHLANQLATGLLPLFNPYQMGGVSFAGNVQAAIFYPPRFLLALLLGSTAFGVLLLLHLCFASLGTSLLAERLGADRFGCLVSAAAFSLGGFMAGKVALPPILMSGAFLPWLILGALLAMEGRPLVFALALFSAALSGHPQTILISCLFAVSAAALAALPFRLSPAKGGSAWFRLLRLLGLMLALAYTSGFFTLMSFGRPLLSPVRITFWLMTLALVACVAWWKGAIRFERRRSLVTTRTISRSLMLVTLAAAAALALLLPVFAVLGDAKPPRTAHRIERFAPIPDRTALAADIPLYLDPEAEASLAMGPLPLLLALLALFRGRLSRGAAAAALVGLASYILAAGSLPVRFLLLHLPGFRLFPALPRYLIGSALSIALLAGLGMTSVRLRHRLKVLLLAAAVVPLFFLAHSFGETRRTDDLYRAHLAATHIMPGQRYITIDKPPAHYGLDFRRAAVSKLMMSNLGMVFEREDMQGYDPIHPLAFERLSSASGPADFIRDRYHLAVLDTKHPEILRLAGVRFALVEQTAAPPAGFRFAASLETGTLFELDQPLPRAFMATGTRLVPDPSEALTLLGNGRVPLRVALLQAPAPDLPSIRPNPVAVTRPRPGHLEIRGDMEGLLVVTEFFSRGWQARIKASDFQSIHSRQLQSTPPIERTKIPAAKGRRREAQILESSDFQSIHSRQLQLTPPIERTKIPAAKGRRREAQILEDRPRPLLPVDGAFMAVPCRAGTKLVQLAYLPFSVRLGLFLAFVFLCLAAILGAAWMRVERI